MKGRSGFILPGVAFFLLVFGGACEEAPSRGEFSHFTLVGDAAGEADFDAATARYSVSGRGANIWGNHDDFAFLWKPVAGDVSFSGEVTFEGTGGNSHRKAALMIRAGDSPDSAYVDAVVHGDGLVSLQFRRKQGGPTEEIQAPAGAPQRLLLERHGSVFSLEVAEAGGEYFPVGAVSIELPEELQAGLAVCSHDAGRMETALFSNVSLESRPAGAGERQIESTLEIIDVGQARRRILHRSLNHFEAPNWSPDGSRLLFNMEGKLYTIPVAGGQLELLDTGFADQCNNDHGYSPDGTQLAISHSPAGQSLIYLLPSAGGTPRLVTPSGPSYWHGWSPDGRTLAYCAERNGEYDVYTIPAAGGRETRLTDAPGLDDGPDYSPDGRYIYFNSARTGVMRIYRMKTDGSDEELLTFDEAFADWFPHPSPDGRHVVFLSYDAAVEGHPPNQEVVLRIMGPEGGEAKILTRLFGGQGTINVPSWSPDSSQFAFVSYRLISPAEIQ